MKLTDNISIEFSNIFYIKRIFGFENLLYCEFDDNLSMPYRLFFKFKDDNNIISDDFALVTFDDRYVINHNLFDKDILRFIFFDDKIFLGGIVDHKETPFDDIYTIKHLTDFGEKTTIHKLNKVKLFDEEELIRQSYHWYDFERLSDDCYSFDIKVSE